MCGIINLQFKQEKEMTELLDRYDVKEIIKDYLKENLTIDLDDSIQDRLRVNLYLDGEVIAYDWVCVSGIVEHMR